MSNRTKLRKLAKENPPTRYFTCREFLKDLHAEMKFSENRYSYRQLAEDLGFSATNVIHLFVQGKRPISQQAALRIIESLGLRKDERLYFLILAKLTVELPPEQINQALADALELRSRKISSRIDQQSYQYYSAWYHVAVREMVALQDFTDDPKWVASHVWPRISVKEAEESLELLKQLGMIAYDKKEKKWKASQPTISTGPEVANLAVTKYHQVLIPQGLNALANVDQNKRHISALTLCVSEEQVEAIKKEIEIFQQKLLELEQNRGSTPPDQVVQLNMQLYPSTMK